MSKYRNLALLPISFLLIILAACGPSTTIGRQVQHNPTASLASSLGLLSGGGVSPIAHNNPIAARPAAVSWGGTRNDVFYIGSDHTLRHLWSENGQVSGSFSNESWGGFWAANQAVAATTWGPGRLDVFLVGQDHQLYHYWQDGGPGAGLEAIGGNFDPSETPAAISRGVGRLDLFLVNSNGQLDHYWQDSNVLINDGGDGTPDLSWHEQLAGGSFSLQAQPSVISKTATTMDVFLVGADHRLRDVQLNDNVRTFSPIVAIGSVDFDYNAYPASVHWGNLRADVFIVAANALHHFWSDDNSPFGQETVQYPNHFYTPGSVSAISSRIGRLDVFVITPDHLIDHVWQDSSASGITWNEKPLDTNFGDGDFVTALTHGSNSFDLYFDESSAVTGVSNDQGIYHATPDGVN